MKKYIYKITNDINNKLYIGQTKDLQKRIWKHTSVATTHNYKNSPMYDDMNKFGTKHFHIQLLEICEEKQADEKERFWIKELNTLVPNGYNILIGGTQLFGENNYFYGKHHSEKTKTIISQKNKGRIQSYEEIEMRKRINSKTRSFYGKHHSEETKKNISKKNYENGSYEKSSKRMKENNPNKDGKYSKHLKCQMIDSDNNIVKTFDSLTNAGRYCIELGLTNSKNAINSIIAVCKGKQKSAYGYYWSYITEAVQTNENIVENTRSE